LIFTYEHVPQKRIGMQAGEHAVDGRHQLRQRRGRHQRRHLRSPEYARSFYCRTNHDIASGHSRDSKASRFIQPGRRHISGVSQDDATLQRKANLQQQACSTRPDFIENTTTSTPMIHISEATSCTHLGILHLGNMIQSKIRRCMRQIRLTRGPTLERKVTINRRTFTSFWVLRRSYCAVLQWRLISYLLNVRRSLFRKQCSLNSTIIRICQIERRKSAASFTHYYPSSIGVTCDTCTACEQNLDE
jgi:hypothetical protein